MRVAIDLSGHWDLVEPTGELLQRAASVALGDGPIAGQVSIASRELLENTVKYSRGNGACITLEISEETRRVCISVENQPDPVHAETLKREIAQLTDMGDARALQHYVGKMATAAVAEVGKSGLGLARIRYECGMALSLETVGGKVRITAIRDA